MKSIPISKTDLVAVVDDEDFDLVNAYSWTLHPIGYAQCVRKVNDPKTGKKKSRCILMHRLVMKARRKNVDHIDGDKLNNTKRNLRRATQRQNSRNRGLNIDNTTGYKGITKNRNCRTYRGVIGLDGTSIYLGSFSNAEDAARAYDEAALRLHGEFAVTNNSLGLL